MIEDSKIWCEDCRTVTGGCWRHNGSKFLVMERDGSLREIPLPAIQISPTGQVNFLAPHHPGVN